MTERKVTKAEDDLEELIRKSATAPIIEVNDDILCVQEQIKAIMAVQQDDENKMLHMQKDVEKLQKDLADSRRLTSNLIKIVEEGLVKRSDLRLEMYDLVGDLQRRTRLSVAFLAIAIMILAVWQLVC